MLRLLDLHVHFAMHLPRRRLAAHPSAADRIKSFEMSMANRLFNYEAGKPRVTLPLMHEGRVGGFGSVLYDPDDEFFRSQAPRPRAFDHLMAQLRQVDGELANDPAVVVARNPIAFEAAFRDPAKIAVFHCVEGAQALGGDARNVETLAAAGIAYVVVAHLFYRGIATCENAIPHLPDVVFRAVNPQPAGVGLTRTGQEIVHQLFERGILVDLTHSSARAQEDILEIAAANPGRPVISSHTGVRAVADYRLNLSNEAVAKIGDSGGVIGVIMSRDWLRPRGPHGKPDIEAVMQTIEAIRRLAGDEAMAIGTDLDGFIRPIADFRNASSAVRFVELLSDRYSPRLAEMVLSGNALRVLKDGWKGAGN